MSDAEWAVVRDAMPVPAWMNGRGGQPEGYCHRQMLDAVRYLVAGGITWRPMPGDFPVWDRVYAFARRWGATGLLAESHDRLRALVRADAGRDPEPTAAIVDSQSVRAAATVPSSSRGYDAGKKAPGRKRHVVVDCPGLLLGVMVTTASVHDSNAAVDLPARLRDRFKKITLVRADSGYAGRLVSWVKDKLQLTVQIVKRSDDVSGSWCCRGAGAWSGRWRGCCARVDWRATTRRCPPSMSRWRCGR